jgi:hypothetical protein
MQSVVCLHRVNRLSMEYQWYGAYLSTAKQVDTGQMEWQHNYQSYEL